MSESNELYASVNYIKHKVDALEKIELLNLRANKALREEYVKLLSGDSLLFEVYKSVDGIKSQKEISELVSTTEMSISNKIRKLSENGLIEIKYVGDKGKHIYKHSVAEQAFKLTKI